MQSCGAMPGGEAGWCVGGEAGKLQEQVRSQVQAGNEGRYLTGFAPLCPCAYRDAAQIMNMTRKVILSLAIVICLCSCDEKSSIGDIKNTVTEMKLKDNVREAFSPEYILSDSEHKKVVGILKYSPAPQTGNFIVWDDDVYQVQAIRFHTTKQAAWKNENKPEERSASVEVFIKFVSKLIPPNSP